MHLKLAIVWLLAGFSIQESPARAKRKLKEVSLPGGSDKGLCQELTRTSDSDSPESHAVRVITPGWMGDRPYQDT